MHPKEQENRKNSRAGGTRRVLRLIWSSARGWTLASICLVIVQGMLPFASLYLLKLVVDSATSALTLPDKETAFKAVVYLIGLAAAVALFGAFCRSFAAVVNEAQANAVTDRMQKILHSKSIEVDLAYYESSQYYDKLHRAQRDAPYRPTQILNSLVNMAQNGISLVAVALLVFSLHAGIGIILFIGILPDIILRIKYSEKNYQWHLKKTPVERQASYFNWLLTGDRHSKEIRLFGLGQIFMKRSRVLWSQIRQEKLKMSFQRSLGEFLSQIFANLVIFGSFAYIAYQTVYGAITLGALVMYYHAFQRSQSFLRGFLENVAALYEHSLFIRDLYEFLDLEPSVSEPLNPKRVPRPIKDGIVFEGVSFKYPDSQRMALENVNISIQAGEKIALVGENGSGKTTLVKLMCRLYDPTEGCIRIDGTSLQDFSISDLRRETSVILQDYVKYQLTARDNIWFGNINVPSNDETIEVSARLSGADKVIKGLHKGYDTILGKRFEEGEELSTGEWQKLALARTFLSDAQIVVLDEPTSSLDPKAEAEVFENFYNVFRHRTVVFISHRFSTIRLADRIYVLNNGKILETGSHDDLVHFGGIYAQLFEKQAVYYK